MAARLKESRIAERPDTKAHCTGLREAVKEVRKGKTRRAFVEGCDRVHGPVWSGQTGAVKETPSAVPCSVTSIRSHYRPTRDTAVCAWGLSCPSPTSY